MTRSADQVADASATAEPDDASRRRCATGPAVATAGRDASTTTTAVLADGSPAALFAVPEPAGRVCAWCRGPIPARARRDSICCSVRCRQARHRFTTAVGRGEATDQPLRLAYADPPYPGKAWLYRDHPDYAGEVDHAELLDRLAGYDGWALSTSAAALPAVLALCPRGAAVAAWHRGDRGGRALRPLSAWEPVVYYGGRPDPDRRRTDSLVYVARSRRTDPAHVIGAKPATFCRWVFELLGARPGDALDDLYPGSGGVGRAWRTYTEEVS